jgi:phenylacetic acid degradation operon negative regulatory protein
MGLLGDRFSYEDFLDSLSVLRRGAYGREVVAIIEALTEGAESINVKGMLQYLARCGRLVKKGQRGKATYTLADKRRPNRFVEQKMMKSQKRWDRTWAVFSYDIPEAQRVARNDLRRRLHWMGFGMLTASTWLSPYDWRSAIEEYIGHTNCPGTFSHIHADQVDLMARDGEPLAQSVWDITKVQERYSQVLDQCRRCLTGTSSKKRHVRTQVAVWASRQMADLEIIDPMLPERLLPPQWPREQTLVAIDALRAQVRHEIGESASRH